MTKWWRCGSVTSSSFMREMLLPPPTHIPATPLQAAARGLWRGLQTLPATRPTAPVAVSWGRGVGGGLVSPHRHLWGWLNAIFNKVDESRIRDVGPDRACAEWLLRCGALVRWLDREQWTTDYNSLPASGGRTLKIEEVDATDSAIMHIGFPHFRGCNHIRRIIFHRATYMDDAALSQLPLLSKSLKQLQISSCGNITSEGLRHLHQLKNLDNLLLYDLPEIQDKDAVVQELQTALPSCTVDFPYALAKDDSRLKEEQQQQEDPRSNKR